MATHRDLAFTLALLCGLAVGQVQAHGGHDDEGRRAVVKKEEPRNNPRAGFWRQVREGVQGYTAVKGQETDVPIQNGGQNWRRLRNGPLALAGALGLGGTVLALGGFYAWRGQVKLSEPRSGVAILRWKPFERALHWIAAIAFLLLALTGLGLLFGRAALIPLLGHEFFSWFAAAAKLLHNTVGPFVFLPGLSIMLGLWAKDNLPNKTDIAWFKAYGGMVGDGHPSAGRINAGEKAWFWLLAGGGAAVCASGLILDFPGFEQIRPTMQLSHLVHVFSALLLMAGALGHIYIGTVGTEGALEGMETGYVDETWAKQHHNLWLEELQRRPPEPDADTSVPVPPLIKGG